MNIKIINKDGKLVGVTDNGEEVPVEFADLESDSVSTEELQSTRQSPTNAETFNPTTLTYAAHMMDSENNRVWTQDGDYYSDDYGDTWNSVGDSVPTGTNGQALMFEHNGYLFAATWEPIELYRTSYSTSGYSWTKVLEGQANSRVILRSGRHGLIDANPNTGTLLIGEYTMESDPYGPKIYRSTDNGSSWSTTVTFDNLRHVHALGHDPYNDGHWIVTLGDNDTQRYAESWDDGRTWERKEFGPYERSQAVGFDFSEDYIYFAEDKGDFLTGPWAYHRETGDTYQLCAEHPKRKFEQYLEQGIQYSLVHDRENGVTYFDVRETSNVKEWGELVAYSRFIGDGPHLLDKVDRARLRTLDGYVFNSEQYGKEARYKMLNTGN